MNIQPVTLRPGQILHVSCLACGLPFTGERAPGSYKNRTDTTILADLDGEPFKAYYHWQCVPAAIDAQIARANADREQTFFVPGEEDPS